MDEKDMQELSTYLFEEEVKELKAKLIWGEIEKQYTNQFEKVMAAQLVEKQKQTKQELLAMMDFALDTRDKEWFMELSRKYNAMSI
jgi:uncharacterized protein YpiB (UPF0302 family)